MSKFMGCDTEFEESRIVLFGAPFDGTVTNRPGARFAPAQIRTDSFGLENYSPYTERNIEDCKVFDAGDLELPFGDTQAAMKIISEAVSGLIKSKKKPLMIGGEHLVTLPAVTQVYKEYKDLCIIHFDAHADLRKEYMGVSLSHSTVMYHIWELLGDNRIFQFGVRSGTKEEFQFAKAGHTVFKPFNLEDVAAEIKAIGSRPVYLTIDFDVLDPSVFPGTGTPEPGGVTFNELLDAIISMRKLNIVACDVVELSPHYDESGISTAAACKAIRELITIL